MGFAADFTAIDFETASRRSDSACQLAAVVVRDGQIVDRAMWMIRPEPFYFSRSNIRIHGITPEQVRHKPTFRELWPEISERLGDDCLVAHNASFDMGVLIGCLQSAGHSIPEMHYTCTRAIARRTWPHHRRYGLKPLSNWLGIRFRHHDALEDSIACAKILLAAGIDREASSLEDLEQRLRLKRGGAGPWGRRNPAGRTARRRAPVATASPRESALPFLYPGQAPRVAETNSPAEPTAATIDLQRLMVRAEFIRPLNGLRVVIHGNVKNLTQQQAESLASRLGGSCQAEVDEGTDLLVLCEQQDSPEQRERMQAQRQRAEALQAQGRAIRIVAEDEFLGLVIA